jgi:hypothetical protein
LNEHNALWHREFSSYVGEFKGESDRAAVILGAAKLDSQLGQILEPAVHERNHQSGASGDLGARPGESAVGRRSHDPGGRIQFAADPPFHAAQHPCQSR